MTIEQAAQRALEFGPQSIDEIDMQIDGPTPLHHFTVDQIEVNSLFAIGRTAGINWVNEGELGVYAIPDQCLAHLANLLLDDTCRMAQEIAALKQELRNADGGNGIDCDQCGIFTSEAEYATDGEPLCPDCYQEWLLATDGDESTDILKSEHYAQASGSPVIVADRYQMIYGACEEWPAFDAWLSENDPNGLTGPADAWAEFQQSQRKHAPA